MLKINSRHYSLLSHIDKTKRTVIGKEDTSLKKEKEKDKYLNLKVSPHNKNIILILKTNVLKLISI